MLPPLLLFGARPRGRYSSASARTWGCCSGAGARAPPLQRSHRARARGRSGSAGARAPPPRLPRLQRLHRQHGPDDAIFVAPIRAAASRAGAPRLKTQNTSVATSEGPILRPRPQRNNAEIASEDIVDRDYIDGDFLCDNEACLSGTQNRRKGRGVTQMKEIFARTPDMPKIKIILNEFEQSVGEAARKLSSIIGCYVSKKLPIGHVDWRLVDAEKKMEQFYDMDEAAFNWFISTAGRKWKEYKADLKAKFFDDTLSDEELMNRNDGRVNPDDWSFLINFWRSAESEALSARGKSHQSRVKMPHTAGSISHACYRHDLAEKLGRPPRRDEVFIKTHTRKNGVPLRQASTIINELKAIVEARPELKERTIQEGDAFAVVCGLKEPRGSVRVLGLGPTAQAIGTPGMKSYMPTKLQMESLAHKRAESEKAALEELVSQMEQMLLERANVETMSQHGSNSCHQVSPRCDEIVDEAHHNARGVEDDCEINEKHDHSNEDDDRADEEENLLDQRQAAAPSNTARNDDAPGYAHDALVGKDVTLFAMLRPNLPVAKGIIISTNPTTLVGGLPLGKQFCVVIVNEVMKRDAMLPRPYDNMDSTASAYMMSITWPYKRLKVFNKAATIRSS